MKTKVAESTQKKNVRILKKVFKGLGDSVSGAGEMQILQKSKKLEYFSNVNIELGIAHAPDDASITIHLSDKDALDYKKFDLDSSYYMNEVTVIYEEHKDYQSCTRFLTIKPIKAKEKIKIRLS